MIQQTLNLRYKQTIHPNWLQVSLTRFQLQAAYCWYNSASESLKEDQSFWFLVKTDLRNKLATVINFRERY